MPFPGQSFHALSRSCFAGPVYYCILSLTKDWVSKELLVRRCPMIYLAVTTAIIRNPCSWDSMHVLFQSASEGALLHAP